MFTQRFLNIVDSFMNASLFKKSSLGATVCGEYVNEKCRSMGNFCPCDDFSSSSHRLSEHRENAKRPKWRRKNIWRMSLAAG